MLINFILACSNLPGLYVIYKNKSKNNAFNGAILIIVCASSIHHLTETNQVYHELREKMHWIDDYGDLFRYADISFAYTFVVFTWSYIGLKNLKRFICDNVTLISSALLCCFICDFIITNQKCAYLVFHFIWHILIYYILYKLSFLFIVEE